MTNDTHICKRSKEKPRNYKLLGFISVLEGYEANSSITILFLSKKVTSTLTVSETQQKQFQIILCHVLTLQEK